MSPAMEPAANVTPKHFDGNRRDGGHRGCDDGDCRDDAGCDYGNRRDGDYRGRDDGDCRDDAGCDYGDAT
jgi:hypothetical protein